MNLATRLAQIGAHWSVRPVQLVDMQAANGLVPRLQVELTFAPEELPTKVFLPLQASSWPTERMLAHALALLPTDDVMNAAASRSANCLPAPIVRSSELETMTRQEVWEAAGGNPGMTPSREGVLDTLRPLDAVCDQAHEDDLRRPNGAAGVTGVFAANPPN